MTAAGLLEFRPEGIYCPPGDFFVDPWQPVDNAIITHAHSDHARWGHSHYLTHKLAVPQLKHRLGGDIEASGVEYGEVVSRRDVKLSLHPAGHIVASSQIRIEHNGYVAVVSGDYKTEDDNVSAPFELLRCHTFVTECTFGLPIYQWRPQREIFNQIETWWQANQREGRASLLLSYSLGKAQRILGNIDTTIGPIFAHGAILFMTSIVHTSGVPMPRIRPVHEGSKEELSKALILAPQSVIGTSWTKRFYPFAVGSASGWMAIRGTRRRKGFDRGFVLSDHVDWPSLLTVIKETGADEIYATHGYTDSLARYLNECGKKAAVVSTQFKTEGEGIDSNTMEAPGSETTE